MINKGMFSSENERWETPQDFFDSLNKKFNFLLDVAADESNHKCQRYFDETANGLQQPWTERNWMNPPYGRKISEWCRKADEEAQKGNLTVALLPARTDTKWYHDYCAKWHVCFVKGRIHFSGGGSAPFPNMIVFFGIER